ncbi:MAG TPA: hypothetical protein VK196_09130, partial [Magnetospirillum sp.]|nr:hypothetical protein [Magnetospirillum sp.]
QDMDQAHADEYMGGRRQELQRLRADPVESIGDRLVNLGFSVSGQLFRTGADGQVELGEATIRGQGLTLEVSGQTGFNLRLDSTPTPIRAEALSPPFIQSAPATLPDSQPASQSVAEVEKMLDRSFARMDTHNALLSQLKPENIEVIRARSGDEAAETYRQDIERKIAQLRFDPAELAPRLAEKGLEFQGALAEKQADGSYARSHFLITGKMPGGSRFSYDSLGGAYLGTEADEFFKLPTRPRSTTAPVVSAQRIAITA